MDSTEEIGVVAEVMGTHLTSHTSKKYSRNSSDNTTTATEVGWI